MLLILCVLCDYFRKLMPNRRIVGGYYRISRPRDWTASFHQFPIPRKSGVELAQFPVTSRSGGIWNMHLQSYHPCRNSSLNATGKHSHLC